MEDKNSKLNHEKRLTELITKVFKVYPTRKNISNLISGNFSITKQQIEEVKKRGVRFMKKHRIKSKIERTHRRSSRQNNTNNGNNPQTIMCSLVRYKEKVKILQKVKKLRGTNIFIKENFSRETMELRKQLWKEVKAHRDKGRVSYLSHITVVVKKGGNFAK